MSASASQWPAASFDGGLCAQDSDGGPDSHGQDSHGQNSHGSGVHD